MSWISNKYEALKLAWQRFERWERVYLLREPEWRIQVDGTLEDFQHRLADRVTIVGKQEFFKRYRKRKTVEILGFCNGNEFALKLPNSPNRLIHYLHGIFVNDPDLDYVYAQYRHLHNKGRRYLGNIHFFLFGVIFFLFAAVLAYVIEWTTDAPAIGAYNVGLLLVGPFFLVVVILVLPLDWVSLILANYRTRNAREETYRLLQEICGNPPLPSNE